jgi:polyphenol oxidase
VPRRERLVAAIGPCIALVLLRSGARVRGGLRQGRCESAFCRRPWQAAKRHFDLEGYCASRLERAGVGRIERLGLDTLGDPERFFSYRRTTKAGERHFGLQVAAITLG